MTGISRSFGGRASWILLAAACGGRTAGAAKEAVGPQAVRVIPLAQAIVLETSGPPPADTSVSFFTGEFRAVVIRHGPPENTVFAQLDFPKTAFVADSGRSVTV
jgi:hypothetical protein